MRHFTRSIVALALVLAALPAAAASVVTDGFAEGSLVKVYDCEYILENYVSREGGSAQLNLPGMPSVELMLPASEGGESETGNFYPIDAGTVLDALAQVRYPRPVDQIEVYLLPYPRKSTPTSSALGRRLFLSPASSPTHEDVIHMVTVHELGHLFQYERMPDLREDLWDEYSRLRGIENGAIYNENADHADRPHEIFAEDFRYLFGGDLANYSQSIENHDLVTPDLVPGLEEFMLSLDGAVAEQPACRATAFPNPFNPRTTLRVEADSEMLGATLSVQIFDASGRLVRDVYRGQLFSHQLSFAWDGRDDRGGELRSGVYFSRVILDGRAMTEKLVMLK